MKLTNEQLKKIIKEELENVLQELNPAMDDLLKQLHPDKRGGDPGQFDHVVYRNIIKDAKPLVGKPDLMGRLAFGRGNAQSFYYSVFRKASGAYDWAKLFTWDSSDGLVFGDEKGYDATKSNIKRFQQIQAKGLLPKQWKIESMYKG